MGSISLLLFSNFFFNIEKRLEAVGSKSYYFDSEPAVKQRPKMVISAKSRDVEGLEEGWGYEAADGSRIG